uniref:Uncharacterized protein n=1 Tax=Chromera velia CCMP2878 TaxID=1169474 RepID=A0A0G4F754_9ALVE|eukprot:Cvel_15573.t1-p1 / transcript=Cvel_15573.t1 / gene=Cvel_15573 / organism=Chromera_velia_CCMP2878 / gene_product=hypothetical protein / transcript_product=hypothetical protein / location=Cvel_scaffold1158:11084-11455(+) / protein_length=124 / sequence_SO=supercontig / SO=protein_coding / is_pseudo=false
MYEQVPEREEQRERDARRELQGSGGGGRSEETMLGRVWKRGHGLLPRTEEVEGRWDEGLDLDPDSLDQQWKKEIEGMYGTAESFLYGEEEGGDGAEEDRREAIVYGLPPRPIVDKGIEMMEAVR